MDLERVQHFLQDASKPIADKFGLARLPENAHFIVASALFFWAVHLIFAPIVSRLLVPMSYGKLRSRNSRNNWCVFGLLPNLASKPMQPTGTSVSSRWSMH